jgi:hypothetical protein
VGNPENQGLATGNRQPATEIPENGRQMRGKRNKLPGFWSKTLSLPTLKK